MELRNFNRVWCFISLYIIITSSSECFPDPCSDIRGLLPRATLFTGGPEATASFGELLQSGAETYCPLAAIILSFGRLYFVGPSASVQSFQDFFNDLMDCDLTEDDFFKLLHTSRPQLAYAYWLMSETSAPLPGILLPGHAREGARDKVVFDFGTNRGYDSAFYLALNFSVVAVDAHPNTERLMISRLTTSIRNRRLVVLNRALVGARGPEAIEFFVCDEDTRSTTDPALGGNLDWCANSQKVNVPAATCADLVNKWGPAAFTKIDVEGADADCLRTLLQHGDGSLDLPGYLSVEIPVGHAGQADAEHSFQLLELLVQAGYTDFKLCRQALFNPPFWGGRLGGSGPFGNAATDWKEGLTWRSHETVAQDFAAIAGMVKNGDLVAEWFDLHAKRSQEQGPRKSLGICLTGHLRGLCEPEHGVDQLYEQILSRFPSFDVFVAVPHKDCDRAHRLFDGPKLHPIIECIDEAAIPPEEVRWLQEGPMTDPDVCDGRYCGYVWRDVSTCASIMQRHIKKHQVSYWRIARARIDLRWERFPENPIDAFQDDAIVWSYAIPDRQWIAMPDRFAIGPADIMLSKYFQTYAWSMNPKNWKYYDPQQVKVCMRRGHMEALGFEGPKPILHTRGKTWPCPEHSARGLAITGPEAVLESNMRLHNVEVRLRYDICFSHIGGKCGRLLDSACQTQVETHQHGYWLNDWEASRFKGDEFVSFVEKVARVEGSESFESGLYFHDGIFAAELTRFFFDEWGRLGRPPKIVDLGAGRGALVEQLDRWYLPVVGLDGNGLIEHTLKDKGVSADLAGEAVIVGNEVPGVWRQWRNNLLDTDWALALDVAQWVPRHRTDRFLRHLRAHGRRGIIISWPATGRNGRDESEVIHMIESMGYSVDHQATHALQRFGGLLCCPSHNSVLVFKKPLLPRQAACNVSQVIEYESSVGCLLGQSYGCSSTGAWVHLGCAAHIVACVGGHAWATDCSSEKHALSECPWQASDSDACSAPVLSSQPPGLWPLVRNIKRSDFVVSMRQEDKSQHPPSVELPITWPSSQRHLRQQVFAQLFGLPFSHVFDGMDPLTSTSGAIWSGDRSLTMAMIKAFKLTALDGEQLRREVKRWDRQWQLHHTALARWATWCRTNWHAGVVQFAIFLSSLRVVASHMQAPGRCREKFRFPTAETADVAWKALRPLQLSHPCAIKVLRMWDFLGHRTVPRTRRPVSFFTTGKHGRWHQRFQFSSSMAQYLYRVAYHSTGFDWTSL